MSSISGLNSTATVDLMKLLQQALRTQVDFAENVVKVSHSSKVAEAEATGLGMAIDVYA